ncbi:hypothetical protein PQQ51_04180 [Paraburkholderia xenovorans]|uniref:hypothetical protein n=1 Tax=Paraburkholderia xenovorans TaxID=36873 RepID=UPI0038BE029A
MFILFEGLIGWEKVVQQLGSSERIEGCAVRPDSCIGRMTESANRAANRVGKHVAG